ncbi:MAG: hypothetical protein IID32_10010 [Planctomycetes bacterium]|nr:hypothetical protein [Planctomycetota bacterium]
MKKLVSVDFRDTPIDDVIRILTKQADVDVVKSPLVTGNITATITDIPLEEALENILAAHGYAFIATTTMIRIIPRSEIVVQEEKIVSKVYRITYADPKAVAESLKDFLSDKGEMAFNPGTSNIMITDIETKIKAIDDYIEEVDRVIPQIMVEVRIYDISIKARKDIGVNWSAGRNTTFDSSGNATGGNINPFVVGAFDSGTSFTEAANAALRFGIMNSSINLDATLRLEEEIISAKLLANPRIRVLDNESANIKIISEIPFQELTQTSAGGNIGTTQFKEVGVELTVTPHVTRDDMIRLRIKPKFSVQTGEVAIGITGSNITSPQPIVDTREADTTALIRNGETVVLGGLRKQEITKQINKVPFFGDLPIIGPVFRFEGDELITSELVVFITPRILVDTRLTAREKKQLAATDIDLSQIEAKD